MEQLASLAQEGVEMRSLDSSGTGNGASFGHAFSSWVAAYSRRRIKAAGMAAKAAFAAPNRGGASIG